MTNPDPATEPQLPDGTTVLVVDDEPNVRRAVRRLIEFGRTTVVEAADGERAIEIVARDEAHLLDAVLTDLVMPVVTGLELIAVLQHCRPDLPLLAMSAWMDGLPGSLTVPFLHKPFSYEDLVQTLAPLVLSGRASRQRARQPREKAAESRPPADHQHGIAKQQPATAQEMLATLVRLRGEQGRQRR